MFTLFNLQGALGDFHRVFASLHRGFHRSAQLIYTITSLSFCQALFSFLFKMFEVLNRRVLCFFCFSRSSLHIILHHIPFVNTFFQLFSSFFSFVDICILATISCGFSVACIQVLGQIHGLPFSVINDILYITN